jgi:hypothetical protein
MVAPVDQSSFAELVVRFQDMLGQQEAALNSIAVQSLTGAGPIALDASINGGARVLIGNGNAIASISVTLPATAPVGTIFCPRQTGAGPLKFVVTGTSTLVNRNGHDGTAGQWAGVCLTCEANDGGQSARWVLEGDTAVVA